MYGFLDRGFSVDGLMRKLYKWTSASNVVEVTNSMDAASTIPNMIVYYSKTQAIGVVLGNPVQVCVGTQRYDVTTQQCVASCGGSQY